MISDICLILKVQESLFQGEGLQGEGLQGEGSFIPVTIKEALIYLDNIQNNVPIHIKNLFKSICLCDDCIDKYDDDYIIKKVEYLWLISEIKKEIDTINDRKSKYDALYNSIVLCLENYETYKKMGGFKKIMQDKINEVIDSKELVKRNHEFLYEKSLELQDRHIYDNLVDTNLIKDKFKIQG